MDKRGPEPDPPECNELTCFSFIDLLGFCVGLLNIHTIKQVLVCDFLMMRLCDVFLFASADLYPRPSCFTFSSRQIPVDKEINIIWLVFTHHASPPNNTLSVGKNEQKKRNMDSLAA
jgi:hypothetical protein